MPSFLLECDLPDHADTVAPLHALSRASGALFRDASPDLHWLQAWAGRDRLTCLCLAPSAAAVREHARRAGLSGVRVREVTTIMRPTVVRQTDAA